MMPNNKSLLFTAIAALSFVASASFSPLANAASEQMPASLPLSQFGENPGELTASVFSPTKTPKALVVLLHGCVQNAEKLAVDSGFRGLAQSHNFALLLPQQSKSNNIKQCFNWFSTPDTARDQGETLSLKNMINTVKGSLKVDKVYIAGLSAGGAMASGLLVTYPQMFDGGAVIAGLPYPCADNLIKAISCMRAGPSQSAAELVALAQKTSPKAKSWPPLFIATGDSDKVVNAVNSQKLAEQWAALSGSKQVATEDKLGASFSRWKSGDKSSIELVTIKGMDHGWSVNPAVKNGGSTAPFLPKAQVSTAQQIVDFWQLN